MSTGWIVVLVIAALLLLWYAAVGIKSVPANHSAIVERLGRFHGAFDPGIHFLRPVVDKVKVLVDLRERIVELDQRRIVISHHDAVDEEAVLITGTVRYQVLDPRKAVYEIIDVDRGVEQVTLTVIGDALRGMTPAAAVAARPDAVRALRRELAALEDLWGLRIANARIDLVEPEPTRVRKDPHL